MRRTHLVGSVSPASCRVDCGAGGARTRDQRIRQSEFPMTSERAGKFLCDKGLEPQEGRTALTDSRQFLIILDE
jgi:hypothetical protein